MSRRQPMTITIYVLKDPRDGVVRYVGQTEYGLRDRLIGHVSERHSTRRVSEWVSALFSLGIRPTIETLEVVTDVHLANDREEHWIQHHAATVFNCTRRPHPCDRTERHMGIPATDALRTRVLDLVKENGEEEAAKRLNVGRTTLARILGGLGLRRGTLALLSMAFDEADRKAKRRTAAVPAPR